MVSRKMRYGIDLGTTNSSLCRIEGDSPRVIKTDNIKDTLPSCVSFSKKHVTKVGDSAYNDLRMDKARATKTWRNDNENVFLEFKRTMGLDTAYECANMGRSYSSEELSAEVLKELKSFVSEEKITAAVITVPAKFTTDQVAATKRAAEMAGIRHCELLQEPIAAAMAYGLKAENREGCWIVFDFGGGTFDAALLDVSEGVMHVRDTEGDNYLGGKNLDYALVDEIIIPKLKEEYALEEILADPPRKKILRNALKFYAEQAKNQLSFKEFTEISSQLGEFGNDDNDEPIDLDMIIRRSDLEPVVIPLFQKAINIVRKLIARNNIERKDIDSLILVGGPTFSPVLRRMLTEQVTDKVDTSIDPMTAVAKGAALFASSLDDQAPLEEAVPEKEEKMVALELIYESNSVNRSEYVAIKLVPEESRSLSEDAIGIEIAQTGHGVSWNSGIVRVDSTGDVVECPLNEGRFNTFSLTAYDAKGDRIPCFPSEFSIMHGFAVGNAVLPYHIGIEATNTARNCDEFVPFKGLEKNQSLPAVGIRNGLKTPKELRPGKSQDRLIIPVYQGEHNAAHTSAVHNDHVCDLVITGEDLDRIVPAESEVDNIIKVDSSQMMIVEVTFPVTGETVERPIDVPQRSSATEKELDERIQEAEAKFDKLEEEGAVPSHELREPGRTLMDLRNRFSSETASEDGRMHLMADIRRAFILMEHAERDHRWEILEAKLQKEFAKLDQANWDLGREYSEEVSIIRARMDEAVRFKDEHLGRSLLKDIDRLFFRVTRVYQLINFFRGFDKDFDSYNWKDYGEAQSILQYAMELINNGSVANEAKFQRLAQELLSLLEKEVSEKIKL